MTEVTEIVPPRCIGQILVFPKSLPILCYCLFPERRKHWVCPRFMKHFLFSENLSRKTIPGILRTLAEESPAQLDSSFL
jgi:hypothetical protein